jgi:hypothetical protein
MEKRFTHDKMLIKKDMSVWICPALEWNTTTYQLTIDLERYIVIEILNSCMVYMKRFDKNIDKFVFLTRHMLETFSTEEKAILQRTINLDKLMDRKKALRDSVIKGANIEISQIQKFKDELRE